MTDNPFITFVTPTYRRPQGLARCMASVEAQTAVGQIEHLILPDYVGRGIAGMYVGLREYANHPRGRYVHFLADDDVLASPDAVEKLMETYAMGRDSGIHTEPGIDPPAIIVKAEKGGKTWPQPLVGEPKMGSFDLGCMVVRRDIWSRLVAEGAYRPCYEGDYWFAATLWQVSGRHWWYSELVLSRGAVSHGRPETTR